MTAGTDEASTYSREAVDLVTHALTADMLAPIGLLTYQHESWIADPSTFTPQDAVNLKATGVKVVHPAVGRPRVNAYEDVLRYLCRWNGFIANYPEHFIRLTSGAQFEGIVDSARIGVVLGTQSAHHFIDLDHIDFFHSIGQRIAQLTYNDLTWIGSGCTERVDCGLSDFGVAVVERMNAVGMTVDVSHCGDRTTLDAIEASTKPVFITHSNPRALAPGQPRAKTDEAIRKLAAKGGVFGISSIRNFVSPTEPTTIENWVENVDHVARLAGIEHVAIGSDIDILGGWDRMDQTKVKPIVERMGPKYMFRERMDIEGLDHPRKFFDVAEALLRHGYSKSDVELVIGKNAARILKETWDVPPRTKVPDDASMETISEE